jgi:putative tricarboxylic transport membrane protein
MKKNQIVVGLFVLTIAVIYAAGAFAFPSDRGYAGISSRFFPSLVAGLLAVCAVGLIWHGATGGFRNFTDLSVSVTADVPGWLWVSAGLLLNAILIEHLGFTLAGTLLFVFAARGFGSKHFAKNGLIGVALALPVFLLFSKVLKVNLPALVPGWI